MDHKEARKVLQELERRAGPRLRLDPDAILFGPQRAFVEDDNQFKIACCSRRAGKSTGIAYELVKAGLKYEREVIPYITLTRDTAKLIIWPALNLLDKQLGLGLEFKENTGDIVFPNKARIVLRGCDDRNQVEKLRGPRYPIAVIDEAQAFPSFLEELIDDVLVPATVDFHGQIMVTGTPNAACRGIFYEMCQGRLKNAWSQHNWTLRDNPHLRDVDKWLASLRKRKGWTEQHPTYLREYCGQWVRDSSGLVYKVDENKNLVYGWEDDGDWNYVLGIDLGFSSPTAFVVVAYSASRGEIVAVESYKESGLIPSAVAARVEQLMQIYDFESIVADSGGFGKGYVEEMKTTYGLPIQDADKAGKVFAIEALNGGFSSGAAKVDHSANADLWEELTLLQWKMDKLEHGRFVEDVARFHNHLCDAFLYASSACHGWVMDYEQNPPKEGTLEWYQAREEAIEAADEEAYNRTKSALWWDDGAVDGIDWVV